MLYSLSYSYQMLHLAVVFLSYLLCIISVLGELCSMEEKDGRNILQCAWARVRRVLSDYDFTPWGNTDAVCNYYGFFVLIVSLILCSNRIGF